MIFQEPLVIKRENGILKGSLNSSFYLEGNPRYSDNATAKNTTEVRAPSLQGFITSAQKLNQTTHIYKINANTFRILMAGKSTKGNQPYDFMTSAIYIYVSAPVAATPAPSPAPGLEPSPATPPSASTDLALSKVCANYPYADQQVACLQKFTNVAFPEGTVATCKEYPYADQQVNCLVKLKP